MRRAAADQPTAVYGGDTITITRLQRRQRGSAKPRRPGPTRRRPPTTNTSVSPTTKPRRSRRAVRPRTRTKTDDETLAEDESSAADEVPEEFLDQSNPFYAAKKAQKEQAKQTGPAKPEFKDTSDAASDILRRLMERRRAEGLSVDRPTDRWPDPIDPSDSAAIRRLMLDDDPDDPDATASPRPSRDWSSSSSGWKTWSSDSGPCWNGW